MVTRFICLCSDSIVFEWLEALSLFKLMETKPISVQPLEPGFHIHISSPSHHFCVLLGRIVLSV